MDKFIKLLTEKYIQNCNNDFLYKMFDIIISEINRRKIQRKIKEKINLDECEETKNKITEQQKIRFFARKLWNIEQERRHRGVKDYRLTIEHIKDVDFLSCWHGVGYKTIKEVTSHPQLYFDELNKYYREVWGVR